MFAKTIVTLITATVLAVTSHAALAEAYFGVNLTKVDSSHNDFDFDVSLKTFSSKLGVQFHENFSAEIRAGVGIDDDTVSGDEVSIDNFYGAYIRGGVQAGDRVYPYLIAGYSKGEVAASRRGSYASESGSGYSYGVGVDIKMFENLSGNIEYMTNSDKDDGESGEFAIGITVSF